MLEHADEAVRLASADARAARSLARSVLSSASDVEARSAAERALGLAAIELGDADAAVRTCAARSRWRWTAGSCAGRARRA